jgi:hypothetical protein
MNAMLCGKWALAFSQPIASEGHLSKTRRSYLHYVAEHRDMVAAKCLATEWLLGHMQEAVGSRRAVSVPRVAEYFAGAGIMTSIIQGMLAPQIHTLTDSDVGCVAHLQAAFPWLTAGCADARKELKTPRLADLQVLDFPSYTVLHGTKQWAPHLDALFATQPRYVFITDTACSYLGATRGCYEALLKEPIVTRKDYTVAASRWYVRMYGYRIIRAAYRGRNAAYYLLEPGRYACIVDADFPLKSSTHGFVIQ